MPKLSQIEGPNNRRLGPRSPSLHVSGEMLLASNECAILTHSPNSLAVSDTWNDWASELAAEPDIGGVLVAAAVAVAADHIERHAGVKAVRETDAEAVFALES